jgi:predicted nucleic acid-binding protein
VKAFLEETGTEQVLELLQREPAATSRLSYVECQAAFARAGRDGRLTRPQIGAAVKGLQERWAEFVVVEFNEVRMERAGTLAQEHSLRAGDAIHLASALRAAEEAPEQATVACWDARLWETASKLGFAMAPPTRPR